MQDKNKLFVINLERILSDKKMSKKDLADKLHCTPQSISNYIKRGVPEDMVPAIATALDVSEKELYRTEAENEFYALKKIRIEDAVLATTKGKLCIVGGFLFLSYIVTFYKGIETLFATLIMLLFFEVVGTLKSNKVLDRTLRIAMRITEGICVVSILIYPFLEG